MSGTWPVGREASSDFGLFFREVNEPQRLGDFVGDVTVVAFGVLTLVGLALVGFGALRRARILLVAGSGLLLALAGAWTIGLPGAAVGLVALGFLRRRRSAIVRPHR